MIKKIVALLLILISQVAKADTLIEGVCRINSERVDTNDLSPFSANNYEIIYNIDKNLFVVHTRTALRTWRVIDRGYTKDQHYWITVVTGVGLAKYEQIPNNDNNTSVHILTYTRKNRATGEVTSAVDQCFDPNLSFTTSNSSPPDLSPPSDNTGDQSGPEYR
jgi:hypothetical protein